MELDENEALDIAFIPRLIEKEHGAYICESLAGIFKKAKIPDKELKMDVAVILMTMILNYIPDKTKQEELLEVMEMDEYKDDMEELVYSIYGKELSKKDNTIQQQGNQLKQKDNTIQQQGNQLKQKDNTIQQQGNQLKQKDKEIIEMKKNYNKLAKIDNLPPEAKKIINSMFNAK